MVDSSVFSTLRAYAIPLVLFSASVFFQLVVVPRSFPPSHYDVLGIARYSSIEEVSEAYKKLSSKWNTGLDASSTIDYIKIQYAYELLTNPLWKRDYDIFGIDEQLHVIQKVNERFSGPTFFWETKVPLLDAVSVDPNQAFDVISSENFLSKLNNGSALLVQVFSFGSNRCTQFSSNWKRIANYLDGVANVGMVEVGDVKLATYLAEKKSTGEPFFRFGLPSLVAFPPSCRSSKCIIWYAGEVSVDAVSDWFATDVLNLPRIPYYSKESLVQNFLAKSSRHKVKVIFISKTGQRATPFVRQASKAYWAYASFGFAVWREEESVFWSNTFGVVDAPAIVFLKDPGVKPVVFHGSVNNTRFVEILEQNKHQVLPQLRSITSMELGCDPQGYSRAGNDVMIWYCAVLAARQSPELHKMRETIRRVHEILSNDEDLIEVVGDKSVAPAALALKEKRLTFAWVDGEAQNRYCLFYVNSEHSYETCGPRKDMTDVPRLFIIRYYRNSTDNGEKNDKYPMNAFMSVATTDVDPTSQLVALYNGSDEIPQIMQWISGIIRDGDTRNLPFHKARTPKLVPEDADPIWSRGTKKIVSSSRGIKQRFGNAITGLYDRLGDPRIGPMLLLGALISFGGIFVRRSQSTHAKESNASGELSSEEEVRPRVRQRAKPSSSKETPPLITDVEPKDAYQMEFSGSESD